jgi:hypothetical protein
VITNEYLVFYRFNLNVQKIIRIFIVLILLCLFVVVLFRCEKLFMIHRSLCFFETFFQLMIGSDRLAHFFPIFFIPEMASQEVLEVHIKPSAIRKSDHHLA